MTAPIDDGDRWNSETARFIAEYAERAPLIEHHPGDLDPAAPDGMLYGAFADAGFGRHIRMKRDQDAVRGILKFRALVIAAVPRLRMKLLVNFFPPRQVFSALKLGQICPAEVFVDLPKLPLGLAESEAAI